MLLCVSSKAMGTCSQNIEWKKEQLGAFFRIRKGPQIFGREGAGEARFRNCGSGGSDIYIRIMIRENDRGRAEQRETRRRGNKGASDSDRPDDTR